MTEQERPLDPRPRDWSWLGKVVEILFAAVRDNDKDAFVNGLEAALRKAEIQGMLEAAEIADRFTPQAGAMAAFMNIHVRLQQLERELEP